MKIWMRLARAIDAMTGRIGRGTSWLALAMVAVGAYNAVVRYLGRFLGLQLSSNLYIELQWYLFSLLFLLAAADGLRRGVHVRVDVLYGRLSRRGKAWINLVGTCCFLVPFAVLALVYSWPSVRNSWQVLEGSPDPGGLPRYPIKSVILVAFLLLLLQGLSEIIRRVYELWWSSEGDGEG